MDRKINKTKMIKKITEKLKNTKIVVGGNKELYKRKYHLKYSQEIVNNVLSAFFDCVADALAEGDTISIKGCIKIEPKLFHEMHVKNELMHVDKVIPERYKPVIKPGEYLIKACDQLNKKEINEDN